MNVLMALLRAFAILLTILVFSVLAICVGRRHDATADRLAVLFCRSLLRLLGIRLQVRGTMAPPCLVVANHVSWIDVLALGSLPQTGFLAKSDVARWPVVARFARLKETVFVDRRRRRSILPANAAIAAHLVAGRAVVVFPEGTTTDGSTVGRFGASHFAAALTARNRRDDIAVQPAALVYDDPRAAWIGDDLLVPHLWSVLRHAPLTCTLAFAPPIVIAAGADRKVLARAAHAAVAAKAMGLRETTAKPRSDADAPVDPSPMSPLTYK